MTASELRELATALNYQSWSEWRTENESKFAQAAEVLELVAWAEERKMAMSCDDRGCVCVSRKGDVWTGDSLLGAIRAAKEAYEQSR